MLIRATVSLSVEYLVDLTAIVAQLVKKFLRIIWSPKSYYLRTRTLKLILYFTSYEIKIKHF